VSAAIPPSSWYGTLLKGVLNFSPRTTWLELAAYVGYVVPTLYLFFRPSRAAAPRAPAATPAHTAAAASR
jgi:high-affinity iron transporter